MLSWLKEGETIDWSLGDVKEVHSCSDGCDRCICEMCSNYPCGICTRCNGGMAYTLRCDCLNFD